MKVLVLGHKGMLGHIVARYLREKGVQVITTEERYTGVPGDALIAAVECSEADWVINAIGKIKQKSTEPFELFLGNSLLPAHVKSVLRSGRRMLHASTDCVFSGRRGHYRSDEPRDAEDLYGLSKILGEEVAELGKCHVIRTSIIGPEIATGSGLMGWFLSQKTRVNGFTNHHWNGITTLEWAKLAYEIISGLLQPIPAIVQTGTSRAVSKYELLNLISETWGTTLEIQATEAPNRIDRTLSPNLARKDLRDQLQEFAKWYAATE